MNIGQRTLSLLAVGMTAGGGLVALLEAPSAEAATCGYYAITEHVEGITWPGFFPLIGGEPMYSDERGVALGGLRLFASGSPNQHERWSQKCVRDPGGHAPRVCPRQPACLRCYEDWFLLRGRR